MAPRTRSKKAAEPAPAPKAAAPPKVHRKFDSDDEADPIPEPLPEPTPAAAEDASDSDSDDDEAPEAVTTSAGRDLAAEREAAAAKAIEAQEAAARAKRKAREARLAEQAKEKAKKRKASAVEPERAPAQLEIAEDSGSEDGSEDEETGGVRLLPASLLEKISSERRTPPKEEENPRHIRIEDGSRELKRLKRKAKDVVVDKGVVSVKVLKDDRRERRLLAPKAVANVVNKRRNLMQRGGFERREVVKSFAVNRSAF